MTIYTFSRNSQKYFIPLRNWCSNIEAISYCGVLRYSYSTVGSGGSGLNRSIIIAIIRVSFQIAHAVLNTQRYKIPFRMEEEQKC